MVLSPWSHALYHNHSHTAEPLASPAHGWTTRLSINSRRAAGRPPDAGNDLQCVTGCNSSVMESEREQREWEREWERARGVAKGGRTSRKTCLPWQPQTRVGLPTTPHMSRRNTTGLVWELAHIGSRRQLTVPSCLLFKVLDSNKNETSSK